MQYFQISGLIIDHNNFIIWVGCSLDDAVDTVPQQIELISGGDNYAYQRGGVGNGVNYSPKSVIENRLKLRLDVPSFKTGSQHSFL